ncbi:MAG: hypothetical protein OIF50_06865, partial [Flavobacteriaceae bacterium]|nr:hypothetical protein [Flavobacteriaceae bacterium]
MIEDLELQKLKKELSKNNNFEYETEIDSIYNTINQRKKELDSVFLNLDVENIYGDHLKIKDPIFNSNKM